MFAFFLSSVVLDLAVQRIEPAMDFSFPGIAEDVGKLQKLLREGLKLIHKAPVASPALLNLACGRADETGVLIETFSLPGHGGTYLGMDLRQAEIHEATRRWGRSWRSGGLVEFRVADAAHAHQLPGDQRYDCVFIRHQNYWDAPATWDQIYRHALARLKESGLLLFTSYFEREHELALAALQTQGARLLLNLPHTASRPLPDAPGKSVDRRLAILAPPH
jgi:hypothetical protein